MRKREVIQSTIFRNYVERTGLEKKWSRKEETEMNEEIQECLLRRNLNDSSSFDKGRINHWTQCLSTIECSEEIKSMYLWSGQHRVHS